MSMRSTTSQQWAEFNDVGFKPPTEANPNYKGPVTATPPEVPQPQHRTPTNKVIEALCLGLQFANDRGDQEAAVCMNDALSTFTELAYERGRFTRENELMRIDIEWLRNEFKLLGSGK
jgi:hypothetical protein